MADQKQELPPMAPELRAIMLDAYRYRQKYQHPVEDKQFWSDAAAELSSIAFSHNAHPFARAILLACLEDIEREYKQSRS
jgi:hypothetical protein